MKFGAEFRTARLLSVNEIDHRAGIDQHGIFIPIRRCLSASAEYAKQKVEIFKPGWIIVDARHMPAEFGKTSRRHEPDVACANHANFHSLPPRGAIDRQNRYLMRARAAMGPARRSIEQAIVAAIAASLRDSP